MFLFSVLKGGEKKLYINNTYNKKINRDAIAIKTLLDKGYTKSRICLLLVLKKQKVSLWANTHINKEIKRRT